MAAAEFLNVDLDIESNFDPAILKAELGRKVIVLSEGVMKSGIFYLHLETAREFKTPDDVICAFCSSLARLSPKAKRAWRSAHKKEFNVGHDIIIGASHSEFFLKPTTLKLVAALGATLGVTSYNLPRRSKEPPKRVRAAA